MSRINTNVQSLIAQRVLGGNNNTLSKSLERLSTGYRINRGADDPAGLIASEKLRSEKAAISAAIGNAERADQVVNIAEGGLQEINNLLIELQSLVGQSANDAGLSVEEREANQLQIDSILQTIDRISAATTFEGTQLLNGNFDFQVEGISSDVADYKINGAKLETGDTRAVTVVVTASAQHGGLFLSAGDTQLDLSAAANSFTFELTGSVGSREFSFASGTNLSSIAAAVNTFKSITGVSAATSGTGLVLKSTQYGSDHFVSVKIVNDGGQGGDGILTLTASDENTAATGSAVAFSSTAASGGIRDEGQDVGAIINGIKATSQGKNTSINTDFLSVELELTDNGATTLSELTAFTITGGGAKFNLGPQVNITNQVSLGIQNVASRFLGRHTAGDGSVYRLSDLANGDSLNVVDGNIEEAQNVVNSAIANISQLRGRLGAFQKNIVGATIRSLGIALENTSAAESSIRDTDFAAETANLTRSQILVNAATNVLAIANSQPQSVLQLLG